MINNRQRLTSLLRLLIVGMIVLPLAMTVSAQDKDTCAASGWEPMGINDVNIVGTWTTTNNRDCKESARWQYSTTMKITTDKNGNYFGQIYSEEPTQIFVSGNQFRWSRDVRRSTGPDKNKVYNQNWTGSIQKNRRTGAIRIYGTWTGAFFYVTDNTNFNHDFMIVIK